MFVVLLMILQYNYATARDMNRQAMINEAVAYLLSDKSQPRDIDSYVNLVDSLTREELSIVCSEVEKRCLSAVFDAKQHMANMYLLNKKLVV